MISYGITTEGEFFAADQKVRINYEQVVNGKGKYNTDEDTDINMRLALQNIKDFFKQKFKEMISEFTSQEDDPTPVPNLLVALYLSTFLTFTEGQKQKLS